MGFALVCRQIRVKYIFIARIFLFQLAAISSRLETSIEAFSYFLHLQMNTSHNNACYAIIISYHDTLNSDFKLAKSLICRALLCPLRRATAVSSLPRGGSPRGVYSKQNIVSTLLFMSFSIDRSALPTPRLCLLGCS